MAAELRQLTIYDNIDIYKMLQEIPKDENGFINSIHGGTFEEYQQWLFRSDAVSRGAGLEDWMVPSNTYWLYIDGKPVGFGKVRHYLTNKLMEKGGHIGYSIRPSERNKGYGTVLLRLLIEEARKIGIEKVLVTINNNNAYSIKVALNNKGVIEKVSDERHYIWICTSV